MPTHLYLQVYGKPCTLGNDVPECVFNNPLALSPRSPPSALSCMRATDTETAGTCRIGPNKHGDACNQDGECASNDCLRELRRCKGVDEGEVCRPGFPDPCQPGFYCTPSARGSGTCQKVVNAGKVCPASEACERGFYCAGPDPMGVKRCVQPFSVPDYRNTTVAPWMCASANAVLVAPSANEVDSIYNCRPANETSSLGRPCNPRLAPPLGYTCTCSNGGGFRLKPIGNLGTGSRVDVWKELFTCLNSAQGLLGDLCEFDSYDMTHVRYGSCAYYACYPQYLRLVNATGSIPFNTGVRAFEDFATCELDAATSYYANVFQTPCLQLPNLENWRCASDVNSTSLSVSNTSGVIAVIFLLVIFGYIGHMYAFRRENGTWLPFVKS